ncbi:MAG: LysR family transcriptional regulator [Lacrimispora sp.]
MNFLNIKYFIAIVEEKSFSAAARKLFVSQQSLSEHIKKMENELGVPLFKRESPLSLTVAGECLLEGGEKILAAYEQMTSNISSVTENRRSRISIGIATYDTPPFLADMLAYFSQKYPQFEVTVVKRQHNDIAHNMRGVDLYISYLQLDDTLEHAVLIDENSYSVIMREDLLYKTYGDRWQHLEKELLNTQDLSLIKELPFLILKDRHGNIARDLNEILTQYNFTPIVSFSSESGDLNAEMCLKGLGCLLAPTDFIKRRFFADPDKNPPHLYYYPVNTSNVQASLTISYEKGKHLHAAEICFINEARKFLQQIPVNEL